MKGDFSRFTHDPRKHYSGVLRQQGRVDLDADWNENVSIRRHLSRSINRDVVGDCGTPWSDAIEIDPPLIRVRFALDDRARGWAVGARGIILSTEDGGESWTPQPTPREAHGRLLFKLFFRDALTGWVVGSNGTILHTQDGGATWELQKTPVECAHIDLYGVWFSGAERERGWVVGEEGILLYTEDEGATWSLRERLNLSRNGNELHPVSLEDVAFIDDVGCIVGHEGAIFISPDGGESWEPAPIADLFQEEHPLWIAVAAVEDHGFCAVGTQGAIAFCDDPAAEWQRMPIPNEPAPLDNIIFWDVSGSPETSQLAIVGRATVGNSDAGYQGIVLLSEDRQPPERATIVTPYPLYGISRHDDLIHVVGRNGTICRSTDRGDTWHAWRDILVTHGHAYVEGTLCQFEEPVLYSDQNDLPGEPPLEPEPGRTDLVYLDAWDRHITALEDPAIRETALGGPDTATRVKTIAQVRIQTDTEAASCDELGDWAPQPSGARLTTEVELDGNAEDPCLLAPISGYQGMENRLYRIEIHDGSDEEGKPTFKWSRDNAAVRYRATFAGKNSVELESLGKDRFLTLKKGDWVEVLDEQMILSGRAGTIAKIEEDIDPDSRIATLSRAVDDPGPGKTLLIVRWDVADEEASSCILPVSLTGETKIEHGIRVAFSGDHFRAGDYWTFSARALSGTIDKLVDEPPHGITHHYTPLGLVTWHESGRCSEDCGRRFPALTEMTRFYYVSGTGQQMTPDKPGTRQPLPQPLQVGVANGQWPVQGARIRFEIDERTCDAGKALLCGPGVSGQIIDVETTRSGIAACLWEPDPSPGRRSQRVEATLLTPGGRPFEGSNGIAFHANIAPNLKLRYLSGDGQEAEPGAFVPCALRVGVEDEQGRPVPDIGVTFELTCKHDCVSSVDSADTCTLKTCDGVTGRSIPVKTNENGIARIHWRLGTKEDLCHTVSVYFADSALRLGPSKDEEDLQVRFHAIPRFASTPEPEEEGIRVEKIVVGAGGGIPLRNDSPIDVRDFRGGIGVHCSAELAPAAIRQATCFVTLELPYPMSNEPRIGFQSIILDGKLDTEGKTLTWAPAAATRRWLGRTLPALLSEMRTTNRILAHLTIRGSFVWSDAIDSEGKPLRYLDGDLFGAEEMHLHTIDARFPSGDGHRGGNLELWFWLTFQAVPRIQVTKTANPVTVRSSGGNVAYTVNVKNISHESSVTIHEIKDSLVGEILMGADLELEAGQSLAEPIVYEHSVERGQVEPVENTVTVIGVGPDGQIVVGEDTVTVEIEQEPARVSLTKAASPETVGYEDRTVTYTITVTNDSTRKVRLIGLKDTLRGDLSDLLGEGIWLDRTSEFKHRYTEDVPQGDTNTFDNTATISYIVEGEDEEHHESDTASVHIESEPDERGRVALVYDMGGRGDLSFNDMAALGADRAAEEFGYTMVEVQSATAADYVPNLRNLAQTGEYALIIAVGFLLGDALATVSEEFPEQRFAIIDVDRITGPNIANYVFKEHEMSALIGALNAMAAAQHGHTRAGIVLGVDIPILHRFEAGFRFGMDWGLQRCIDLLGETASVGLLFTYTGTFSDVAKGKAVAAAMLEWGAVGIYNVAGPLGMGILDAITEWHENRGTTFRPPWYFGVDANQDWMGHAQHTMASGMKRVDVAVYSAVKSVHEGTFVAGVTVLGLTDGGVAISKRRDLEEFIDFGIAGGAIAEADRATIIANWEANRECIDSSIWSAIDEMEIRIIDGSIVVPAPCLEQPIEAIRAQYPLGAEELTL